MADFTPRIPDVTHGQDMGTLFEQVRRTALPKRQLAILQPDRQIVARACPTVDKFPKTILDRAQTIAPSDKPLKIAVIAYTDAQMLQDNIKQAIPFFQYLMALAATGHSVWLFEGHPSALAEGVREADLLIVGGGMAEVLQKDWMLVVYSVMGENGRWVVWGRDGKVRAVDAAKAFGRAVAPGDSKPLSFIPHMPVVDVPVNPRLLFEKAREFASANPKPKPGDARITSVITPGRSILQKPGPPYGTMPGDQVEPIHKLLTHAPPANIAVIAYTDLHAVLQDMERAIPFLGYLMAFSYVGHTVWVFEGHPCVLAAGTRDADILLVDGGMIPHLQPDWREVVRASMRGKDILVHNRDDYSLYRVAD